MFQKSECPRKGREAESLSAVTHGDGWEDGDWGRVGAGSRRLCRLQLDLL